MVRAGRLRTGLVFGRIDVSFFAKEMFPVAHITVLLDVPAAVRRSFLPLFADPPALLQKRWPTIHGHAPPCPLAHADPNRIPYA